MLLPV